MHITLGPTHAGRLLPMRCPCAGFQDAVVVPPMFVLMGNFHSKATGAGGPAAGTRAASTGKG